MGMRSHRAVVYTTVLSIIVLCFLLFPGTVSAAEQEKQGEEEEEKKEQKGSGWLVLPIVYYTPETKIAVGAGAMYYWRPPHVSIDSRPSNIAMTGTYTQLKQWDLTVAPDLFFKDEEYRVQGLFNVRKFVDKFYGIGNDNPVGNEENYTTRSFVYYARFQKQIFTDLHLALQHDYQYNNVIESDPGGQLESDEIPGSEPSSISGFSLVMIWDSRDNLFAPYHGSYWEASAAIFRKGIGSDYNFERYNLNLRSYIPTFPRHVLALQLYGNFINGEAPFQILSYLGGQNFMRGYYMGRFRDKHAVILQSEYRLPVWWRFGGAAFASVGDVVPKLDQFKLSNLKVTYGVGIRFAVDPKERLNLRLDFAWADDTAGFYFTFIEAF
jgi:outer membrane protein assembly factor BamA